MVTVCNYVLLDKITGIYAGDTFNGDIYVAVVNIEAGDRFKFASWFPASETQKAQYWAIQREIRLAAEAANHCPETGESVFFCTCGYH